MDAAQIVFLITAVVTLGSALMVVTTRNMVSAALWLVLTLFGVAVFYVLLSAGFLAVAQVIIYIGAIAILVIFAVMLTRRLTSDNVPFINSNWWVAILIAALLFGGLSWMFSSWDGFTAQAPPLVLENPVADLGAALVDPQGFVLPFELASVLLLAALIGSIMIAWEGVRAQRGQKN